MKATVPLQLFRELLRQSKPKINDQKCAIIVEWGDDETNEIDFRYIKEADKSPKIFKDTDSAENWIARYRVCAPECYFVVNAPLIS